MPNITQILIGDRLGKEGKLRLGCSAIIFDRTGTKVLFTRRTDNGQWCLPGGAMDPGESAAESCEREVLEETGFSVRVKRLIGVYSDPNQLVIYPDGNRVHIVALSFQAEIIDGKLRLSEETSDAGFFSLREMEAKTMLSNHKKRVEDALLRLPDALIR